MSEHNPRCAIYNDPPGTRSMQDCNCGAIPPLPLVADVSVETAEERYVISPERLAEIEGLLNRSHAGWQIIPNPGVTVYDLAAAVFDLLCEKEERDRG